MSALADVVIGVVELVEAEARKLRTSVKGLVLSIVLILAAGLLILGAVGWLVAAAYLQLLTWLPPAGAAAVIGVMILLVAGGILWYAMRPK
jgi:protein-S-isoprenylcysteine O-methyltransferase Ste14